METCGLWQRHRETGNMSDSARGCEGYEKGTDTNQCISARHHRSHELCYPPLSMDLHAPRAVPEHYSVTINSRHDQIVLDIWSKRCSPPAQHDNLGRAALWSAAQRHTRRLAPHNADWFLMNRNVGRIISRQGWVHLVLCCNMHFYGIQQRSRDFAVDRGRGLPTDS